MALRKRKTRDYTGNATYKHRYSEDTGYRSSKRRRRRRRGMDPMLGILLFLVIVLLALLAYGTFFVWNRKPTMALNGDKEMTVAMSETFEDPGVTAKVGDRDISNKVTISGAVDTTASGDYTLTYHLKYRLDERSLTRKVHVRDLTPPQITLSGIDDEIKVAKLEDYKEPGYQAVDNADGDITSSVAVTTETKKGGIAVITYQVTDRAGNKAEASRTIILEDDKAPVITILGDKTFRMKKGMTMKDPGVTVKDNVDGDLTDQVKIESDLNADKTGTYKITYTVSDSAGNTAAAVRKVKVYGKNNDKIKVSEGASYDKEDTAETKAETAEGSESWKGKSIICLTYDDGPSTKVTPQILDTLKANDVKATFFIIRYPDSAIPTLKRMVDEGHTIGLHAWSHDYDKAYGSMDSYYDGIVKLQEKLKKDIGYETWITRFPGGASNTISRRYTEGVMTHLTQKLPEEGFNYVDWNADSTDATGNNVPVDTLVSSVISELRPGHVNIVLDHDTNAKQTTADALQQIIDYGKEHGYEFRAITMDTPHVRQGVNN